MYVIVLESLRYLHTCRRIYLVKFATAAGGPLKEAPRVIYFIQSELILNLLPQSCYRHSDAATMCAGVSF